MSDQDDYRDIDVMLPESYQSTIFKVTNKEEWERQHWNIKETHKKAWINEGKIQPIIEDWCYWSDDELVYLATHFRYYPVSEIARQLGRTKDAIFTKLKTIKKDPQKCEDLLKKILSKG